MSDKYSYAGWAEAFTIFEKYGGWVVTAEHDVVFAGPHPDGVSEPDRLRLVELGWHGDRDLGCWKRFT